MRAGRVHSVIAAGLENPQLLARWRREPETLRGCGVEPGAVDLAALWKFAGLAVKVRHNGLRSFLPHTFRLLSVAGLEIDLFASYAAFRAARGNRYADTAAERAQDLLTFLEGWLDLDRPQHALLWDVIRYELALDELRKPDAPAPHSHDDATDSHPDANNSHAAVRPKAHAPRARSVPHVRGRVVLHETRCDPRAVAESLYERPPRLGEVRLGQFHFCYWRAGADADVNVLQLDELGFYLLALADGRRTAAEMARLLGGRSAKPFLGALGQLASVGVLAFDAPPGGAA